MGGPLGIGEIEDLVTEDNKEPIVPVIKCPWHYHKIDMNSGCKWNQGVTIDSSGKATEGEWKSVSGIQRTFKVEEREDGFYVFLDNNSSIYKSDEYAFNPTFGEVCVNSTLKSSKEFGDGKLKRSGQVFNVK